MINIFLKHKAAFLNAVIMAFIIFAPVIFFPFVIKDAYRGINIGNFEVDEFQYMAKGREILEGHKLGNIVLREGKDWHNIQQTYIEYLFMAPVKILGLNNANVPIVFYTFGFMGTLLLILINLSFFWQISSDTLLSLAAALFAVGGYTLVTWYYPNLSGLNNSDINIYSRPSVPLYASLFLFLCLNLLIKSTQSEKFSYVVWSGVSLGALFYTYFYGWTFAYAILGALFCVYLLKKDFKSAKKVFFVGVIGLLSGSYVLFSLFEITHSEIGKRILLFTESHGRYFSFSKIAFIALAASLIYWFRNRKNLAWPILLAISSASWIVLNQQIITNQSLQPGHYFWYFVIPMSALILIYICWSLIPLGIYRIIFSLFLIFTAYTNTIYEQWRGMKITTPFKEYAQAYRPIIDYLNNNLQGGVVLASDRLYRTMILVYTPYDLFWNESAPVFNTPPERFKEALFVYFYLNKESRNDFSDYVEWLMNKQSLTEYEYPYQSIYSMVEIYESGLSADEYHRRTLEHDASISELRSKILPRLASEYEALLKQPGGVEKILKNAGVNYILWDKNRNPEWSLSGLGGVTVVVAEDPIYLYKIEY